MSSYDQFCFLQHIRSSGFTYVDSSVVLPSAGGLLRDVLSDIGQSITRRDGTFFDKNTGALCPRWEEEEVCRAALIRSKSQYRPYRARPQLSFCHGSFVSCLCGLS
jgi:hypothetical protein